MQRNKPTAQRFPFLKRFKIPRRKKEMLRGEIKWLRIGHKFETIWTAKSKIVNLKPVENGRHHCHKKWDGEKGLFRLVQENHCVKNLLYRHFHMKKGGKGPKRALGKKLCPTSTIAVPPLNEKKT